MFHHFPTISWLAGFSVNPCHLRRAKKTAPPLQIVRSADRMAKSSLGFSGVADLAFSSRIPHTVDGSEIQRLPVEGKVV